MRLLGVLALLVAAVTACGGDDGETAEAARTVSVQTTCDLLFVDDEPRLWSQAVDVVAATAGHNPAAAVADQLEQVAASSGADLRPFIEDMAAGVRGDLDSAAFKTAAREVANTCTPYVAG